MDVGHDGVSTVRPHTARYVPVRQLTEIEKGRRRRRRRRKKKKKRKRKGTSSRPRPRTVAALAARTPSPPVDRP
ncbi:hypothetical protein BHM03_00026036 [Ensete ventricosum]|nr:hypothetical protein BHM03_00026036 [Ensete ventricosum]